MYATSDRFLAAAKESHTVVTRVDVLKANEVVSSGEIEIVTGMVTMDENAAIRRSLECELLDPFGDLIPDGTDSLLDPITSELRIWRGYRYSDGTEEVVPLGTFRMSSVRASERDGQYTVAVTGYDRSFKLQGRTPAPFAIDAGTTCTAAIQRLLTRSLGSIDFHTYVSDEEFLTLLIPAGANPWQEAGKLALAVGAEVYFDRLGHCVIGPYASQAAQDYVWNYLEGETATFYNPEREVSPDDLANVVVVVGTHSAAAGVSAVVGDDDPTSPTYRYGPFGEQVWIENTERVATVAQAQSMARALLAKRLGPSEQISFYAVPNPALDLSDTIQATRLRLGINETRALVKSIRMPVTANDGPMYVQTRRSVFNRLPQVA